VKKIVPLLVLPFLLLALLLQSGYEDAKRRLVSLRPLKRWIE
jgi:hypothetical protein